MYLTHNKKVLKNNEYRTFEQVETTIRKGTRQKEEN
jgi:hypothetical protein